MARLTADRGCAAHGDAAKLAEFVSFVDRIMDTLVSIYLPTRNRRALLQRAALSVLDGVAVPPSGTFLMGII